MRSQTCAVMRCDAIFIHIHFMCILCIYKTRAICDIYHLYSHMCARARSCVVACVPVWMYHTRARQTRDSVTVTRLDAAPTVAMPMLLLLLMMMMGSTNINHRHRGADVEMEMCVCARVRGSSQSNKRVYLAIVLVVFAYVASVYI